MKIYEIDVEDTYKELPKGITCLKMITLQDHKTALESQENELSQNLEPLIKERMNFAKRKTAREIINEIESRRFELDNNPNFFKELRDFYGVMK